MSTIFYSFFTNFFAVEPKIKEYFHAGSQAGYCCDKVVRGTKG